VQHSLKSGIVMLPVLLFFAQDCFDYSRLSCFCMNFRIDFSISVKNVIGILMVIALNLYIVLVYSHFHSTDSADP
jgi:hypothetical protein